VKKPNFVKWDFHYFSEDGELWYNWNN